MENVNGKIGVYLIMGILLLMMGFIPYILLTNDLPIVFVVSVSIVMAASGTFALAENRKLVQHGCDSVICFIIKALGNLFVLDGIAIILGRWFLKIQA